MPRFIVERIDVQPIPVQTYDGRRNVIVEGVAVTGSFLLDYGGTLSGEHVTINEEDAAELRQVIERIEMHAVEQLERMLDHG